MNRYLTLAVCQTGPIQRSAARPETVSRLVHLLERAAAAGAELAVFPELALTTFFPRWSLEDPREIDSFYETQMPGSRTQPLYDAARRLNIGFALGFAELGDEDGRPRRFNSMELVGADGALPQDAHPRLRRGAGGGHDASGAALLRARQSRFSGV